MTVIWYDDLPVTAWKNGGGMTRELLVERFDDDSPALRISMATVAQDGPFSAYPGVARVLTLLSGDPLALTIDGDGVTLAVGEVLTFDGGATTTCRLTGGTVEDLGVMTWPSPDGTPAAPVDLTIERAEGLTAHGVVAVVVEAPVTVGGTELGLGDAVDLRDGHVELDGPGRVAVVRR